MTELFIVLAVYVVNFFVTPWCLHLGFRQYLSLISWDWALTALVLHVPVCWLTLTYVPWVFYAIVALMLVAACFQRWATTCPIQREMTIDVAKRIKDAS